MSESTQAFSFNPKVDVNHLIPFSQSDSEPSEPPLIHECETYDCESCEV